MANEALTAIDLFSGAGGISLGLSRTGYDVLAAVDIDRASAETHMRNISTHKMLRVRLLWRDSSRLWDEVVGVARFVDSCAFLCEVVAPVVGEVAVAVEGSEFEDGFGAVQAPARAGEVHAVFDEVAAGTLDDAGGDGPATLERGGGDLARFGRQVPVRPLPPLLYYYPSQSQEEKRNPKTNADAYDYKTLQCN